MALEIERKFLVVGDYQSAATRQVRITQGYLSVDTGRTVRIRRWGDCGFLTIKGASTDNGLSRLEWEKEITLEEVELLLPLCLPGIIDKTRWLVPCGEFTFEVDEFHGDNAGLIVAEIELPTADAIFEKPDWLGQEVTGDRRYYNSQLTKVPYCKWHTEK
jgi:hypothetical protein